MKKFFALLLASVCVLCSGCGSTPAVDSKNDSSSGQEDKREMTNHAVYDKVDFPETLWADNGYLTAEEEDREEDSRIKGVYITTFYKGVESYAFAYLGIPDGVNENHKAPAILLVHGGGGTAYWEWVQRWVNLGFVVLAPDMEGHVPTKDGTMDSYPSDLYTKSKYDAPNNHNYNDASLTMNETWMYYATTTAICGNTFLHNLNYVDKYSIGICGISWGGVITSIVSGYDDRFAFSIPIYCSLNMANRGGSLPSYYTKNTDALVWDDDGGLKKSAMPKLFVCSDVDPNTTPDSISVTYANCQNARLAIIKGLLHSQSIAANLEEPYSFAKEIVMNGQKGITVKNEPSGSSGSVEFSVPDGCEIKRVYLMTTTDDMTKQCGNWDRVTLESENGAYSFEITDSSVKNYYIYAVEKNSENIVSTKIIEL